MTNKDLIDIMKLQELLNIAYCGPDWRANISRGNLKSALIAEYGEFLAEVEYEWKWWAGRKWKFDLDKTVFEFVDTMHFMLALILKFNSPKSVEDQLLSTQYETFKSTNEDYLDEIAKELTSFLRAVDNQNMHYCLLHFNNYVEAGRNWFCISDEDIVNAYKLKNALNIERACGGVNYDRSKERTLTLGKKYAFNSSSNV